MQWTLLLNAKALSREELAVGKSRPASPLGEVLREDARGFAGEITLDTVVDLSRDKINPRLGLTVFRLDLIRLALDLTSVVML